MNRVDCYNLSATDCDFNGPILEIPPKNNINNFPFNSIQLKLRIEIEENKQYFIYFKFRRDFSSARSGRRSNQIFLLN